MSATPVVDEDHSPSSPLPVGEGQGEGETHAQLFLDALEREGFDFFAGVPCSLLTGVIRLLDSEPRYGYVSAVKEDAAVGMAAGAWMGGGLPVVFMQNSGLGTSFNALASLTLMYELPLLLVVSWRGQDGKDAPEHILMGQITGDVLDALGIPQQLLEPERIEEQIAAAARQIEATHKPAALVVPKGILE
jgi:phosphonopyruvate decarboxylase